MPPTSAWYRSGYWVAEWLPQIVMPLDLGDRHVELGGELGDARGCGRGGSWRVNRSAGTSGACGLRDERVGVGRVADDEHPDVVRGARVDRSPCGAKMPPLASSRSPRSMPFVRGRAPTSSATLAPSNAFVASSVMSTPASSGNAQSSSSSAVPSAARTACGISSSRSRTGVSGPSSWPGGDAEQQRVADLARRSGDGDVDRCARRCRHVPEASTRPLRTPRRAPQAWAAPHRRRPRARTPCRAHAHRGQCARAPLGVRRPYAVCVGPAGRRPVASAEPARISANDPSTVAVSGSPSSSTPAATATAGLT